MSESKGSIFPDERVWYDQFTSTDWVHDAIADSYRVKQLRSRKDVWGRIRIIFDGAQGWILSALSGCIVALMAYTVDVAESSVFDFKDGYCTQAWYLNERVSTHFVNQSHTYLVFASNQELTNSNIRPAARMGIVRIGGPGPPPSITRLGRNGLSLSST